MYIPLWVVHLLISIACVWEICKGCKQETAFDFGPVLKVLPITSGYLFYWIIVLILTRR